MFNNHFDMKKIFALILVIAAVVACEKKEKEKPGPGPEPETPGVVATVTAPGGEMKAAWAEGDSFTAIQKTGNDSTFVTFKLVSGAGTAVGSFKAETETATEETVWTAVLGKRTSIVGSEIHCTYKGQDGKPASIDDYNYVIATASGLEPAFDFSKGKALSYVIKVKLPAGIKAIEYTPSAYFAVTNTGIDTCLYQAPMYPEGEPVTEMAAYASSNTGTITLVNASAAGEEVYIAVPAINFSHSWDMHKGSNGKFTYKNIEVGVIITILNDKSDDATKSNGTVMGEDVSEKGGKSGVIDLSGVALLSRPKPSEAIHMTATDVRSYDTSGGKYYMDITTDCDIYWAPYNVGATAATEVGNYYAWGELEPKDDYSKDSYSLYEDVKGDGTKTYTIISSRIYGEKDNSVIGDKGLYTIRGTRYDVARVKWGKAWRMAGVEEAYGLSKGTVTTTATAMTVTKDGSTVTIPVCGRREGTTPASAKIVNLWTVDYTACTWLGDQAAFKDATSGKDCAWMISNTKKNLNDIDFYSGSIYREYGLPVRAVLETSSVVLKEKSE